MLVTLTTVIITFGILAFIGLPIDLMMTISPVILMIIGTSFSIHFISKLNPAPVNKTGKSKNLHHAVRKTLAPLFFNALTTSVGFLGLWLIPVEPIQYFGLFTDIGIIMAFLTTFFVIPSCVKLSSNKRFKKQNYVKPISHSSNFIDSILKFKRTILIFTFLFLLIGLYALKEIKVQNYFLDDLNEKSSLAKELFFFESKFEGIRPFEIAITPKNKKDTLSLEVARDIHKLEKWLKTNYAIFATVSPVTFIKSYNKAIHGAKEGFYVVPQNVEVYHEIYKKLDQRNVWNKMLPTYDKQLKPHLLLGASYLFLKMS